MRVVWNDPALEQLDEIHGFVSLSSPRAATALIARLVARTEQLEQFPESGATVTGVPDVGLRFLAEGRYRIIYALIRGQVEILGVVPAVRQFRQPSLQSTATSFRGEDGTYRRPRSRLLRVPSRHDLPGGCDEIRGH